MGEGPLRDHYPSGFSERVLDRIEVVEGRKRDQRPAGYLLPLSTIVILGVLWTASLTVGMTVVHVTIDALAWVSAVGQLEQHLSAALLGPFAPLPLLVSLLLFIAALGWVRSHQGDPETPP